MMSEEQEKTVATAAVAALLDLLNSGADETRIRAIELITQLGVLDLITEED